MSVGEKPPTLQQPALSCATLPSSNPVSAAASADRLVGFRNAHVKEILEKGAGTSARRNAEIFKGAGPHNCAR